MRVTLGIRRMLRPLPRPMLARTGDLPRRDGYAFEVKWDGFRALVSTEDGLHVRSRRGWTMTELVPELAKLPSGLVLDGELVAFGDDGRPSFPLLSRRMLHGHRAISVKLMIFDVLRVDGHDVACNAYLQRRALLESLELSASPWETPEVFGDGEALLEATLRLGLEGIVAKRLDEPYKPGERGWIKVKHRSYWRFGEEFELARSGRRRAVPGALL
jgi:bifunctional non-homologous end joining protein LigD